MTPPDVPPADDGEPIPREPDDEEVVIDVGPKPWGGPEEPPRKVYVNGVGVSIVAERVEYLDSNGKLVTESLRDFTRKELRKRFGSVDEFLSRWHGAARKQAVIEEGEQEGIPLDALASDVNVYLDPFDLICHVAYDQPPLTRRQRAAIARRTDVFTRYGQQARAVLEALLNKYEDEGIMELDDPRILQIRPFDAMGTPLQLIREFGTRADFERAVHDLQSALYEGAA